MEVKRRSRSDSQGASNAMSVMGAQNNVAPVPFRSLYTRVVVLKSLNDTFQTKYLVVPFKPDALKLGRPVSVNDVMPQVKPDNGNFDSRVLSRNHAQLSCDKQTGKIYIKDLKSSNGTFVNGKKISDETELSVGDLVDLGSDIDSKFEHRKISAVVEDISVVPLVNESRNKNPQTAAFEAAMFGDVHSLELGETPETLSGIFINNGIGTSSNLNNVIKTLAAEVAQSRHECEKLKSMDSFLVNYTARLDVLAKMKMERDDNKLQQMQKELKQRFKIQQEEFYADYEQYRNKAPDLQEKIVEKDAQITQLRHKMDELNTRLEVELYKNKKAAAINSTKDLVMVSAVSFATVFVGILLLY